MRIEGWEGRLDRLIETARSRPYVLGEWDCFRLGCCVIEGLTGVNRWPEFAGYRTKREALAKLAQHGSTFEDAGDWFFASARVSVAHARRGDLLALQDEAGEKHLAVCLGHQFAGMREEGLTFGLMNSPMLLCAWRVG